MTASSASARERKLAAIGTAAFAVAPATAAALVPWLLTRWEVKAPVPGGAPARLTGALLIGAGAAVIANSFVHFAVEGIGTPAPFAPPRQLVVGGLYRYVRNPMYVSIAAAVAGQGLLLGQPKLFAALGIGAVPVVAFVRLYEEPALTRKFGAAYAEYRGNVPRWLPTLTPWRPEAQQPAPAPGQPQAGNG
ncbi:isoprenylcysteine carboxylmethyltransferase family protein [Arthrobacter sp. YAF34]|uniref:methyltransferase family protein n=1 Tax=Arthrobacter sp. YAF34 TaxID=3233083 RepID=UPI003F9240A3